MQKLYRKLTKDQKSRNIIFSSCLSKYKFESGTMHEVLKTDSDKYEQIERLKNDKFFNNSHYNFNIIRQ